MGRRGLLTKIKKNRGEFRVRNGEKRNKEEMEI